MTKQLCWGPERGSVEFQHYFMKKIKINSAFLPPFLPDTTNATGLTAAADGNELNLEATLSSAVSSPQLTLSLSAPPYVNFKST